MTAGLPRSRPWRERSHSLPRREFFPTAAELATLRSGECFYDINANVGIGRRDSRRWRRAGCTACL
jgi:hypothetical protein